MHGHVNEFEFLASIGLFLGFYYLALAAMNGIAAFYLHSSKKTAVLFRLGGYAVTNLGLLLLVAFLFLLMAPVAWSGSPRWMAFISIPQGIRDATDTIMGPMVYSVGSLAILWVLFLGRRFFTRPDVAWALLNLALLFMGLSMIDPDFAAIVTKPDNVPIVGLIFLLGFFTWLGARRAVLNDARLAAGGTPLEAEDNEKVLVWPDLVYIELICMVALTALLLLWAIGLQAPLEEPASAVMTPNPSKAPWYFLGLQEMLVYYDPWMAGVVLPSLVVFGLMAIPFMDFNNKGNGYYTINDRKFAYLTFQFGFLVLWITLIVMGTFLRGPNWNFFGFYETWDVHKVQVLNNVDLSERFWIDLLGVGRPSPPADASFLPKLGYIVLRELPGIALLLLYFSVLPPALVMYSKMFRTMFLKMGFLRYMILSNLLLLMALLPIKMVCRWSFNLKYFVSIPEYFLNF